MASPELTASLDYLTDAAHLLRAVAPETSAHLMSQRAALLYHHGMAVSEAQRQHVCGACGHIMIPGRGTSITLESEKSRRHRLASKMTPMKNDPTSGPVKVVSCGLCHRATRTSLPAPEKAMRRRVAAKPLAQKQSTAPDSKRQDPVTSANASSKKRAKSRKAGLQALLSGQQQRQSNPLSLADFGR